ncbi:MULTISPECIES: sensor histidine kinase [unclassified Caulobacter]|uniref:sensor histidine kinase n=1 Tax=unclassified Caulobacter TaxID=2648921 RepID=UPI0013049D7B|nr:MULTISPECIES: HAMP domain-containing sensor histidine kinase [unclassified Caulobacter]
MVIVVTAFLLAGYLTQVAIRRLEQGEIREHVQGEAASLRDEIRQKGIGHLPYTVAKRTRLWRGFEYRLVSRQGVLLAGRLPDPGVVGWTELDGVPSHHGEPDHRFLVLTETLFNGSRLSVGQDMAIAAGQTAAVNRILLLCGLLGTVFCLATSFLFTRQAWRRIAQVSSAAQQVTEGQLSQRVPVRRTRQPDDIDDLGVTFNAMLDRIGALIGQLRQVTTDIAHDMRTPLTRLRNKIERLQSDARPHPPLARAIGDLDDDVGEILRTFDALLQLAEIETHNGVMAFAPVDLGNIALDVAEAFRPDIEASGRHLQASGEAWLVAADSALLTQVCANLLENALRHTPSGTTIQVRVEREGQGARLLVADDGPGVNPEDRQEALKPFVRLDRSRTTKGSGLGLSIVAAIAARHGARLELGDARPGLRVALAFPVAVWAGPKAPEPGVPGAPLSL